MVTDHLVQAACIVARLAALGWFWGDKRPFEPGRWAL